MRIDRPEHRRLQPRRQVVIEPVVDVQEQIEIGSGEFVQLRRQEVVDMADVLQRAQALADRLQKTTVVELRHFAHVFSWSSPSPPLEERVGERRPFPCEHLNSTAVGLG